MYPMIWWWVAAAAVSVVTAVLASDDSSSSSSADDDERNRRNRLENEKTEREAREAQEQERLRRERVIALRILETAKSSAISFLNEHYPKHQQLSVYLKNINQQDTPYSVKSKLLEIVDTNLCDEAVTMTNYMEKKKLEIAQLDAALVDIKTLKSTIQ